MGVALQQTDTAAVDGAIAACSGLGAGAATDNRTVSISGSAGSSTPTITFGNSTTRCIHWEMPAGQLDGYSIPAGNWVIRLNVTVGSVNGFWQSAHICRVNSSGVSQSTIGSNSTLIIDLSGTGVLTATISGSADTPAAGDRIYIVLGFAKQSPTGGNQSITFKNNQLIDTPMVIAGIPYQRAVVAFRDIIDERESKHLGDFQPLTQVGRIPVIPPPNPFLVQASQYTPSPFPAEGSSLSVVGRFPAPLPVINNTLYPIPGYDYQIAPFFLPFEGLAFSRSGVVPTVPIAPTVPPGYPKLPTDSPWPLDRLGPGWAYSKSGVIPVITIAPTIPPGLPKVPTVQAVPYPTLDFGSAFSLRGVVVAIPVASSIPPGLPQVPVVQSVPAPFPPIDKLLAIASGTAPAVIVKTPLPVQSVQVLPPADLFLQGSATSLTGRFRREPTYIASFLIRGIATYPPQPVFPEQGSVSHVFVSKPLQPFAAAPPEIYIYQATPEHFPFFGSAYTSIPRIVPPLPNRPAIHPAQPVVPPPSLFPDPGSTFSAASRTRTPPVLSFAVRPVAQEVPPQPIYPPQGIFVYRSGVVIVPTVKTPLPVQARESTPPYGAMWPPSGIVMTYVAARPPFDTSGIEPITMSDIYAPSQRITGSISN